MALSAMTDRSRPPGPDDLRRVLGKAHVHWARLLERVEEQIGPVSEVWKFTSAGTGWGLRVVSGERVILYMTPQEGQFLVSFALGERAVTAARAARLAAGVSQAIEQAPRYVEGRGVRVVVRDGKHLSALARVARAKRDN